MEYGVSSNPFEVGAVDIPETVVHLTSVQRQYIQSHHPPLSSCDYLGVDLYLNVNDTIDNMIL